MKIKRRSSYRRFTIDRKIFLSTKKHIEIKILSRGE